MAWGLTTASQEVAKTPKGGFLKLLIMLHDYKASVGDPHARNEKPNATLVVVSLESLWGAHCGNR